MFFDRESFDKFLQWFFVGLWDKVQVDSGYNFFLLRAWAGQRLSFIQNLLDEQIIVSCVYV